MRRHLFSTALALTLIGCGTNPVTGKKEMQIISTSDEIAIGEQTYSYMQQAQGGALTVDPKLAVYVSDIGAKIANVSDRRELPYEFVLLNNSVPNAWALPGGKIAINRGLLSQLDDEAELAAVLAHESVHTAARHGAKTFERLLLMQTGLLGMEQLLQDHKYENLVMGSAAIGAELIGLKYSREAELEADRYGIKYMAAAGYDPRAAVDLQEVFLKLSEDKDPSWLSCILSTHPPSKERISANTLTAQAYPGGGERGEEEYKRAIKRLKAHAKAYECLDKGYEQLMRGREKEALLLADQGIDIEPGEGHLYNLKGKALVKMRSLKEAVTLFSQAIACNDNYFDYYLQRGLAEFQLGEFRAALRDLEKSVSLLPSAEAYYSLGVLERRYGNEKKAMEYFRRAAMADNEHGQAALGAIARVEVPIHPHDYISIETEWERKGKLVLYIRNHSPIPIDQMNIQIAIGDSEMLETISVRQALEPDQTLIKSISFDPHQQNKKVKTSIQSIKLGIPEETPLSLENDGSITSR